MLRLPRLDAPGVAQHVIQRGNNRQLYLACDENFSAYVGWLRICCKVLGGFTRLGFYDQPCAFADHTA